MGKTGQIQNIALIGSYLPRQCGIATFTKSMYDSLSQESPANKVCVIAIDDQRDTYKFPKEVTFEIEQKNRSHYFSAADYLNSSDVDLVCVQHEYGIFGGEAGEFLLDLLGNLEKPIVCTLHTVLEAPNPGQKRVLSRLGELSAKVVVMSKRAVDMLQRIYGIPEWKIEMIHHGVPDAFEEGQSFNLKSKEAAATLLTFGLLSPDKGIENVIQAMPRIVEKCPHARYLIVGATHPHIKAHSGESYRSSLENLAEELGVSANVEFVNRFVSSCELVDVLAEADIYVTPYLKPQQITSGTLAYAVGSGKAVISTPYWYAEELLAEDRGVLVPWRDPEAIADAAIELLTNQTWLKTVTGNAKALGKTMTWRAIGCQYMDMFRSIEWQIKRSSKPRLEAMPREIGRIPDLDLTHVRNMTDDTGLLQHAIYTLPRYCEGYCLDDNCRALLLTGLIAESGKPMPPEVAALSSRYLAFVAHAFDPVTKKFRNFMSYSREWLESEGSEDSQGRALWCLGAFAVKTPNRSHAMCAIELFRDALYSASNWTSPRAWSYTLLGIKSLHGTAYYEERHDWLCKDFATKLMVQYEIYSREDWKWFEPYLTYCNPRVPQALLAAGTILKDETMIATALEAMEWLWSVQLSKDGQFAPLGCCEPYVRGGEYPRFDQQPVEVYANLSACIEAWHVTREPIWRYRAWQAFEWFFGANHLNAQMYDRETGGCNDGLQKDSINHNQGAESTLSFQMACEQMRALAPQLALIKVS